MSDFTVINRGPWRIRTSSVNEGSAAVTYVAAGKFEVVTVETHADLALLGDAISEYLDAVAEAVTTR